MKDYSIDNVLLHNLLQELNSISRMAVMENAFVTQKMMNIYSNLLKYRWNEEGKKVTVAKEMSMALKCCELFRLKNEALLEYTYTENADITTLFIPHYTILAYIKGILSMGQDMGKPFALHIEVSQRNTETWIQLFFTGMADFEEIMERANNLGNQKGDGSFKEIARLWQEIFKEDSFKIDLQRNKLEICFVCR